MLQMIPPSSITARELSRGKDLRSYTSRRVHANLALSDSRDPMRIIETTLDTRIPELVGVRVARMMESPFAFYRGTPDVMAADLSAAPVTGLSMVICGDAHIGNFGLYASPERRLVFDLNDFDEAGIGPWEWDVKRFAGSIAVIQRMKGCDRHQQFNHVMVSVLKYQQSLRDLVSWNAMDRYFASIDDAWMMENIEGPNHDRIVAMIDKAHTRTHDQAISKITELMPDGRRRLVAKPPIMVPLSSIHFARSNTRFLDYQSTLRADRALVISQFRVMDVARRVVGVGSVGTHCSVVLLEGPNGEYLVLQSKEARESVLSTWGKLQDVVPGVTSGAPSQGRRVVSCQEVIQATSDPFLGWTTGQDGRDYYWRQYRDKKGGEDLDSMPISAMDDYGPLCARQLARAHAQSHEAAAVAGYLGKNTDFAEAISSWAVDYADVVWKDFASFNQAIADGRFVPTGMPASGGE